MSLQLDIIDIPDNVRELLTDVPIEGDAQSPSFDVFIDIEQSSDAEDMTIVVDTDAEIVEEEEQQPVPTTTSSFSSGRSNNAGTSFAEQNTVIDDEELYDIVFSGNSNVPANYTLENIISGVPVDEIEIENQNRQREANRLAAESLNQEQTDSTNEMNVIEQIVQDTVNMSTNHDELRQRFSGAPWYDIVKTQNVILAGLGGIGSFVSFFLSRVGPNNITFYDRDVFERHNIGGQLLAMSDIGRQKVQVAVNIANVYSNYTNTYSYNQHYTKVSAVSNVMICGFDNMEARKIFYHNWKKYYAGQSDAVFIDGRLNLENFQVFTITGENKAAMDEYEREHLFNDSEVLEQQCSLKQTSHMAGMIASIITGNFINFCNNLNPENFERPVPFLIEYNAIINKFETHDKF